MLNRNLTRESKKEKLHLSFWQHTNWTRKIYNFTVYCLSVCLTVFLSVCLSVYLSVWLFFLSVCLSVYLSVCLSVCLFMYAGYSMSANGYLKKKIWNLCELIPLSFDRYADYVQFKVVSILIGKRGNSKTDRNVILKNCKWAIFTKAFC